MEYWNKPEKTAGKVQNGWLLTEDLTRMDDDSYVAFVSRKDDVIISTDYRIGPEEVEDSVAGHEAVVDASTDISQAADTRRETTRQLATEISSLSATVEEVAASAQQVDTTSSEAESLAAEGQTAPRRPSR